MNALFGTIRELCHGAPSSQATDALVEVCKEAYALDPEYACEIVLPYVLPELARWSDEVVFGEDARKDSADPFETDEDRSVALQSGRPEALADLRLPTGHTIAFDCGSFSEVMSGGYVGMWDFEGLGPNGDGGASS